MKIKKHTSNFIDSDYGNPNDVKLIKTESFADKYVYVYKILNDNIKMHEGSNRYMGSFYFLDKWYSIIKYYKDNVNALGYYININTPPKLENGVITISDLFLDVWVNPDFTYRVLDMDEFETAKQTGVLEEMIYKQILKTKDDVIHLINERKLPDEFIIGYSIDLL